MLSRQNGVKVEAGLRFSIHNDPAGNKTRIPMLTLIAESKTMAKDQFEISDKDYRNNRPLFEAEADFIMGNLSKMTPSEISERLKISFSLATKALFYSMEFPDKSKGYPALDAFSGEVFKALDKTSLGKLEENFLKQHLLIISSLYGILKPESVIKPYRLEYKAELNTEIGNLTQYWKRINTITLVNLIKETGEKEILNLLPGDASNCFDWKLIKAFVKVEKPDFKIITDMADLKTPNSGRLKELRGLLLRYISEERINSFQSLYQISTNEFGVDRDHSKKGLPLFLCND